MCATITLTGKRFNYTTFQKHSSKETLPPFFFFLPPPLMGLKKSDRMKDGDTPSPFEVFHIQISARFYLFKNYFSKERDCEKRQKECCNLPA